MSQFERTHPSEAKQAAEKLRMDGERAEIGGYKIITRVLQIVSGAFWSDLFLPPSGELSFSAACKAPFILRIFGTRPRGCPGCALIQNLDQMHFSAAAYSGGG